MAARIEALINPELLTWARESAGLSLELAAKRAQVAPNRLLAWERGERRPTIPQLRKFADIYKRPLAAFYLPAPPPQDQPIHDFRRVHGHNAPPPSPELLLAIRRCRDRRELALDLYADLDEAPPAFALGSRTRDTDPEELGPAISAAAGVTSEVRAAWVNSYQAFNYWRNAMESLGTLVFQAVDVEVEEARGFSIGEATLPVIAVNIKDSVFARVFTMLHECAHIVIGATGLCDVEFDDEDTHEEVEAYCNRVAAAALLPQDEFLAHPLVAPQRRAREWPDEELRRLSADFGAGREAVLRRLLAFHLTTEAHYRAKRRQYAAEYAEYLANRQPGFAPHHRISVTSAGPAFTRLVLEAFNRDRITARDVANYLSVRVKHLSEIQRDLAESA